MIWTNYLALVVNVYILFMQGVNFYKYGMKNGANRQRIILFLCTVCMFIHIFKRLNGMPMPFLLAASIGIMALYDGFNFKKWFVDVWKD